MFNIKKIKENLPTAIMVEKAIEEYSPVHRAGVILLEEMQRILNKYDEDNFQLWMAQTYLDLCATYDKVKKTKDQHKANMLVYHWLTIQLDWMNEFWQ